MKNQLFFILFFLLSLNVGFGQTKEIDSLKNLLLEPSLHDTTKVRLYLDLAIKSHPYNSDSLAKYSKLGLKLSKASNNHLLGRSYLNTGIPYLENGQMDSARYYFKKAINRAKLKKDTLVLRYAYSNYAITLRDNSDFNEKVQLNLKVIGLIKNNKFDLGRSQYNLSIVYGDGGYDSLAIKYLKLARKNAKESNYDRLSSYILTSLAIYSLEDKKLPIAKVYIDEMFELCEKTNSPELCHNYFMTLGNYYNNMKMFSEAEKALSKALVEAKNLNFVYNLMNTYISLGEHFLLAENPKKAIENFKKYIILTQHQI